MTRVRFVSWRRSDTYLLLTMKVNAVLSAIKQKRTLFKSLSRDCPEDTTQSYAYNDALLPDDILLEIAHMIQYDAPHYLPDLVLLVRLFRSHLASLVMTLSLI
jgi:hypothetical protein